MKDSYSFDIDKAGLDKSFDLHDAVYRRIFTRCGLKFVAVEADSGSMGGSQSQEFMVYTDAGEDLIASCPVCGYAANLEKATLALEPVRRWSRPAMASRSWFHTPGCAAIADVAAFFKISPASDIKCVAYMALKRGAKGQAGHMARRGRVPARRPPGERDQAAWAQSARRSCAPCRPKSWSKVLQRPAGFLGPVGFKPTPSRSKTA
jgi:prolyl-tRNA synthetase